MTDVESPRAGLADSRLADSGLETQVPGVYVAGDIAEYDSVVNHRRLRVAHWDVAQFLAYLRTWSASQRYLKAKGVDPVALIEADFRAAWGDPARVRAVRWKFFVRAGRV